MSCARPPSRLVLAAPLLAVASLAVFPTVRGSIVAAFERTIEIDKAALAIGCIALMAAQVAAACAWRSALTACGATVPVRRALRCYGVGSLANCVLPGNAGDALRI